MSNTSVIDRVAGIGRWMMEYGRNGKWTSHKTHYFNEGSKKPVCATSIFTPLGRLEEGVWSDFSESVESIDGSRSRNACGHCVSIVIHRVDLKAEHARRKLKA